MKVIFQLYKNNRNTEAVALYMHSKVIDNIGVASNIHRVLLEYIKLIFIASFVLLIFQSLHLNAGSSGVYIYIKLALIV